MYFKENEIIFLFGAGASFEADIPTSDKMIEEVEQLVLKDWKNYKELYYLLKSAIIYADGVQGKFEKQVNYNIERLFNVLIELEKKEEHPLYPFIGQWNIKFSEIIKDDYSIIKEFQEKILVKLKEWVSIEEGKADYYKPLLDFRKEYEYPLHIFSLNYDLCLESSLRNGNNIERGFNEQKIWDYNKFEESSSYHENEVFLYKLHGSIDWERNESTGQVTYKNMSRINKPDLIFGNIYKLQYVDPYLFQFYKLGKYTLDSKIIAVVGYSFGDDHINGILSQALKQDKERKLLYVSPEAKKGFVEIRLQLKSQRQLEILKIGAKDYFTKELNLNNLTEFFPDKGKDDLWG